MRVVLFDGAGVMLIEYTARQMFRELIGELTERGIEVWVTGVSKDAERSARRFWRDAGEIPWRLFPDPATAVAVYRERFVAPSG